MNTLHLLSTVTPLEYIRVCEKFIIVYKYFDHKMVYFSQ